MYRNLILFLGKLVLYTYFSKHESSSNMSNFSVIRDMCEIFIDEAHENFLPTLFYPLVCTACCIVS